MPWMIGSTPAGRDRDHPGQTRDAAIDDLRVDCLDGFVIDTKPVFYVGPIVLDDDVCVGREFLEDLDAFRIFEVKRQ